VLLNGSYEKRSKKAVFRGSCSAEPRHSAWSFVLFEEKCVTFWYGFGAVLVRFCFYTYHVHVPIHRIAKATDDNGNAAALGLLNA
jgi:hypothetical protein